MYCSHCSRDFPVCDPCSKKDSLFISCTKILTVMPIKPSQTIEGGWATAGVSICISLQWQKIPSHCVGHSLWPMMLMEPCWGQINTHTHTFMKCHTLLVTRNGNKILSNPVNQALRSAGECGHLHGNRIKVPLWDVEGYRSWAAFASTSISPGREIIPQLQEPARLQSTLTTLTSNNTNAGFTNRAALWHH